MKNKEIQKRLGIIVLSAVVAASASFPAAVYAQESSAETAYEGNTKEEVIYANLTNSGLLKSAYVVNVFDLSESSFTDYGDYTEVKNLTTTDEINVTGNMISACTDAERFYYQGTLEETELPWTISISYYMDGTEYTADEIAGMSGTLEIKFSITENEKCELDFYDSYALQASMTLDTETCSDISAEDATIADVGSDKQLSFTVLPGKGLDTVITAEVTDFEMEAISINGIQMSLNVEIDDEELLEKVEEIMDAISELNDGAADLDDGGSELSDGVSAVGDGASELESGVESLDEGIESLQSGMATLQEGLETLGGSSSDLTEGSEQILEAIETIDAALSAVSLSTDQLEELVSASGQIQSGIDELSDGISSLSTQLGYEQYKVLMAANGVDLDTLSAGNTSAITQLQTLYASTSDETTKAMYQTLITLLSGNNAALTGLETYLNTVSDGVSELEKGAETLSESYAEFHASIGTLASSVETLAANMAVLQSGVSELLSSYEELDDGLNDYTDGVAAVVAGYKTLTDGVSALASGSSELLSGSSELSDGVSELYEGVQELCDGTSKLLEGTTEFSDETEDLDTQVEDQIDEMIESISGGDFEVVSFVSDQNTHVTAVQFVIQTEGIEISEEEAAEEEEEVQTTFWQKLKALFR